MCIFVKYGTWKVSSFDTREVRQLEQAGYGALSARVLSARGCASPEAAADYLRCDAPLNPPLQMKEAKHREILGLPKVTKLISLRARNRTHVS